MQLPGKTWLYYPRSNPSHSLVFLGPWPDATEKVTDAKAPIFCVNLIRLPVNWNCPRTWSIEFSIISVNITYSKIYGFSQSALTHPAQMDLAEVSLSVVCWNRELVLEHAFYLAMIWSLVPSLPSFNLIRCPLKKVLYFKACQRGWHRESWSSASLSLLEKLTSRIFPETEKPKNKDNRIFKRIQERRYQMLPTSINV